MKKLFTLLTFLVIGIYGYSQCFSDNCIDSPSQTTAVPGCCTGTTAGMTNSYSSTVGCANLTGGQDTWITFMAPSNGYLSINFTAGTIAGTVNMVVFDSFSNADNCATLNAGGIAAAVECFDATTPPNPINLNYVQTGERYFILISSPPGSTPGTFTVCLSIVIPSGGNDCPDATILCDKSSITLDPLTVGPGLIFGNASPEDVSSDGGGPNENGLNVPGTECWASSESSSQWYRFTCSESGTLQMGIRPINTVINGTCTIISGDDYDFMFFDITKSPSPFYTCNLNGGLDDIPDSCSILQCQYSATKGVTGFGSGGPNGLGYTGTGATQGGCQPTTDDYIGNTNSIATWNATDANLVCGRTYALLVNNYTNSSVGYEITWGGTAKIGVQPANITDPVISNCSVTSVITTPLCGGSLVWSYKYLINWGDGTTTTATSTNLSHTYSASGTYTITMLVTDPSGCQEGISKTVTVSCIPLPVELFSFTGEYLDSYNNLQWKTASELNNDYFTIERSIDGVNWVEITRKDGAGNSSFTITYNHQDYDFIRGKVNYYRLSQTDFDGSKEVFKIISVNNTEAIDNIINTKIYDLLGREYTEITSSGTYIVVTYYQSGKMESKMIRK